MYSIYILFFVLTLNEKGAVLHRNSTVEQRLGAESLIFFFFLLQSSLIIRDMPGTTPIQGASQAALVVKNLPASAGDIRDLGSISGGKILWRRTWQPTTVFLPGESH